MQHLIGAANLGMDDWYPVQHYLHFLCPTGLYASMLPNDLLWPGRGDFLLLLSLDFRENQLEDRDRDFSLDSLFCFSFQRVDDSAGMEVNGISREPSPASPSSTVGVSILLLGLAALPSLRKLFDGTLSRSLPPGKLPPGKSGAANVFVWIIRAEAESRPYTKKKPNQGESHQESDKESYQGERSTSVR